MEYSYNSCSYIGVVEDSYASSFIGVVELQRVPPIGSYIDFSAVSRKRDGPMVEDDSKTFTL